MSSLSGAKLISKLAAVVGKEIIVDGRLTPRDVFGEIGIRSLDLVRGVVRLRGVVFLGSRVRIRRARSLAIGRGSSVGPGCYLDCRAVAGVRLGRQVKLGRNGTLTCTSSLRLVGKGVTIGDHTGIGEGFHLGCSGGIQIGSDVIVGPGLFIHSQNHVYSDPDTLIREQGTIESSVVISDNCWIGSRVTILAGTSIGPRTVVASGAVVSGHFDGNEILAGVPARVVKKI
ncbi:acyltransferase [Williamsia sp. M5A3_1d]